MALILQHSGTAETGGQQFGGKNIQTNKAQSKSGEYFKNLLRFYHLMDGLAKPALIAEPSNRYEIDILFWTSIQGVPKKPEPV